MATIEHPRWLYRGQEARLFAKDDEHPGDGWIDHPTTEEEAGPAADTDADEKTALRAELTDAGMAFDKRWGIPRLREALASKAP